MLQLDFIIDPARLTGTNNYAILTRTYADGVNKGMIEEIRVDQADWKDYGDGRMYISYTTIAAKEMGDEITIVIYDANGQQLSVAMTDSIMAYAYRGLNALANAQSEKEIQLRTLLADMLNYGAAAQQYFGYDEENLVNAAMTDEQKSWATEADVDTVNNAVVGNGGLGSALTLLSRIQLDFMFSTSVVGEHDAWADMYALATYVDQKGRTQTVRIDGSDFIMYNNSCVQITVSAMDVADYRALVTCVVYDAEGNEITSSADSMESYANRALEKSTDEVLKAVVKALMKFGASAESYFANNN